MGKIDKVLRNLPPRTRRLVIAVAGGVVVLVGIPLIPLPGPGWLVVFLGFAILAQEFPWANRALSYGRQQYDKWVVWLRRQNWFVQSLTLISTGIAVVVLLWLVNAYGWANTWLQLGQDWLKSPFMR